MRHIFFFFCTKFSNLRNNLFDKVSEINDQFRFYSSYDKIKYIINSENLEFLSVVRLFLLISADQQKEVQVGQEFKLFNCVNSVWFYVPVYFFCSLYLFGPYRHNIQINKFINLPAVM